MKLNFITLSFFAALAFAACTKSESFTPKEAEILVQAGVAQTRAGYEGTAILPAKFVMDVEQNADSKYDYKNVVMVKDGDAYVPENSDNKMIWAGTAYNSVQVKSMTLPYGLTEVGPDMNVVVSENQTTEAEILKSDVLVATKADGDIRISGDMINIDFRHLLSKLEITYAYGSGLSESDVTINSMTLENICTGGGYSYDTMGFQPSVSKTYGDVRMFSNTSSPKFEMIFFPYVPTENPKLVVNATISGETRQLSCPVAPKNSNGFEGGKRYTLKVTVNNSSITTGSISISSGWEIDVDVKPELGDNIFITD